MKKKRFDTHFEIKGRSGSLIGLMFIRLMFPSFSPMNSVNTGFLPGLMSIGVRMVRVTGARMGMISLEGVMGGVVMRAMMIRTVMTGTVPTGGRIEWKRRHQEDLNTSGIVLV
jgi:hypothetical protein